MAYPFYEKLHNLSSRNMTGGNFGLWYNKFIPIKDFDSCKASDGRGNENNAVSYYNDTYKSIKKDTISKLLDKKLSDQAGFCGSFSPKYEVVVFKAKLKTPLITGIGETHPHEVSMVFDHNVGIPYIPASGIKGIVRFAHTLGLCNDIRPEKIKSDKDGKKYFDDEEDWTNISQLFGTQEKRGSVIFLDAYPEKVPDIHVDIMNPHYGKYYIGESPPADYLDPKPLKFLTVAKDTVFIFRALVDKKIEGLIDKVKAAFNKALTEEGVGAKTAVDYGLFDIVEKDKRIADGLSTTLHTSQTQKARKTPESETWENAIFSYAPNTGIVSAIFEGKNATVNDNSLVPENLMVILRKKKRKKSIKAKVKVELIGGKEYRLIEVCE